MNKEMFGEKLFEVIAAEKFLKMCSESINPDLFVTLEEEIIPSLEISRHIKIKRINELVKNVSHN